MKKGKKIELILYGIISILLVAIIIVVILLLNHLKLIKTDKVFKDFNAGQEFSIVLKEKKNCSNEKIKIFKTDEFEVYGICATDVYIKYKNASKKLEDLLKTEVLDQYDIVRYGFLDVNQSNNLINTYHVLDNVDVVINKAYKNYTEIVFSY